jgi:hypothetical protein
MHRILGWAGVVCTLCVVAGTLSAANPAVDPGALWQDVAETSIAQRGERWIQPLQYRAVSLDYPALAVHLARAPMESATRASQSPITLSLPTPDGGYAEFAIVESPIMEPALSQKYPTLRTYSGQGLADGSANLRLDLTPQGFHAQVLSAHGDYYIDPYQLRDNAHYVSYRRSDMGANTKGYRCQVEGHQHETGFGLDAMVFPDNPVGETLRTYRMAIAATPTFTNHFGGTVTDGLGGLVTLVNRLSGVYEREIALRLVLVANNDLIVYTIANPGPLPDPPNSPSMLLQNTINSAIGVANYDLGHAVGGTGGGGSVTPLGNVCGPSKARGITGLNPPRGDIFDIDFVAHELGHQLGGDHTWNGCGGGGQWAGPSAMEPGSGTTIMGYAGICPDNLMPNSDAYFHARSFSQILQIMNSGGPGNNHTVCGSVTPTGNTPPALMPIVDMTIPERTPFQLTAAATDPGDTLTYNWEQVDNGDQGSPSTTGDNGTAPLFRSFHSTRSPTRIFPSIQYILDYANVPPATISLPPASGLFRPGEILPNPSGSTTRVMKFRATVRDNRAGGGGLRHSPDVRVTALAEVGPFAVSNITDSLAGGSSLALTWTVAGTDAAPVSTSEVNILISLDGGSTFSTLQANTPNDGNETVTLPSVSTARARIKVEAANGTGIGAGNTYFDITDSNFAIADVGTPITLTVSTAPADLILVTQGGPSPAPENIAAITGGTAPYTAIADTYPSNPDLVIQSVVVTGNTVSATAQASCQPAAPNAPGFRIYPAVLQVTDASSRSASAVFPVNVSNNMLPTLGTYPHRSVVAGDSASAPPASVPGDPNGNFVGVSVIPSTLPGGGTVSVDPVSGIVALDTTATTTPGTYTIRVFASDTCGAQAGEQFTLTVSDTLFANGFE